MSLEKSEKHLIYVYFVCFLNHRQRWFLIVDERKNIYFKYRIANHKKEDISDGKIKRIH